LASNVHGHATHEVRLSFSYRTEKFLEITQAPQTEKEEVTVLLPELNYLSPKSPGELAAFLADHRDKAKILSGGTDIIPNMLSKLYKVDYLIDLSGLKELRDISYKNGQGLFIGAATTMKDIERSSVIKEKYAALHKAASEVGSPQIRAMATIGGNICNASPAADTPPALVALGAAVTLVSTEGLREMLLADFIQGNRIIDLRPNEYLAKISIPDAPLRSASRFGLTTLRAAVEIDIASFAVNLVTDKTGKVVACGIAMGAVAPVPLRAVEAEGMLIGHVPDDALIAKAAEKCAEESKPIGDIRASAAYRRHLIKVLAGRTIREALAAIR